MRQVRRREVRPSSAAEYSLRRLDHKPTRWDPRLKGRARISAALLCATSAVVIFCMLGIAVHHSNRNRMTDWLSGHVVDLAGVLLLLIQGFVTLLRPRIVLRGIESGYPQYASLLRADSSVRFVRLLGAVLIAIALFMLHAL